MKRDDKHRRFLTVFLSLVLSVTAAYGQEQGVAGLPPLTDAEKEAFLLKATIVIEASLPLNVGQSWRASLDDGKRKHAASVDTSTSLDLSQRDHRFNIAAYELDKLLQLGLVTPSVQRTVNGQSAAVTWWLDGVLMSEQARRINKIDPPDLESWNQQMQAVRVFDELIANAYRTTNPASYTSSLWDNLLISREWQISLLDHTRAFGTATRLQEPESVTRCDRMLLAKLRTLNRDDSARRLGRYLTSDQLDALETRRALIVRHLDEQIAATGEAAVLYDRPQGR